MKMAIKTSWHKPPLWLRIYIEALFWFKGLKATKAVRSWLCSFEWESGRHDQIYEPANVIMPRGVCDGVNEGIDCYDYLVQGCRVHPEWARYALPQGVARKGRICRNFRNLMETALNRMCSKTQQEYREFMQHVEDAIAERDSFLADFLVPKCKWYGYCNEKDGCGAAPHKGNVFSVYKLYNDSMES